MTSSYTFNLFTILRPVHTAAPGLSEMEIKEAYEALVARGNISPNPSPPLTRLETLICDVIARLAREQHACHDAGTAIGRTG
jgi:hypothetical protein